jgi:ABC-type branched-subunit amino acid transport system ATPase component
MLAMARILRTGARLLLLDEITEGLAPVIVKKLGEVIRLLKTRGYTIVLVEQNFRFAAPLADRHYVLEHGRIVVPRFRRTSWPARPRCCTTCWASEPTPRQTWLTCPRSA